MLSLRRTIPKSLQPPAVAGVDLIEQTDYLLATAPSMAAFMAINFSLKHFMQSVLGVKKFPHALVGMFLFFASMVAMGPKRADQVVDFFKPANDLLTSFLPCFFIPGLIVTPLAAQGVSGIDFGKFLAILATGLTGLYGLVGHIVQILQKMQPSSGKAAQIPLGKVGFSFSDALQKLFGGASLVTGGLALAYPESWAMPFYTLSTFFSFIFASKSNSKLPAKIASYWHPLLTTYVASTAILSVHGFFRGLGLKSVLKEYMISGARPRDAAGNLIMFFLEPAIINFGFGLYAREKLLRENALAILGGSISATVFGIFGMAALARLFAPSRAIKMACLPRGTAALAVVQAAIIGASTALTTVNCCLVGITGANFGPKILDLFGVKNSIARGVATGGSGLALASAGLATLDPEAFPFGALSMSLTSTFATLLFSIPQFTQAVLFVMGTKE